MSLIANLANAGNRPFNGELAGGLTIGPNPTQHDQFDDTAGEFNSDVGWFADGQISYELNDQWSLTGRGEYWHTSLEGLVGFDPGEFDIRPVLDGSKLTEWSTNLELCRQINSFVLCGGSQYGRNALRRLDFVDGSSIDPSLTSTSSEVTQAVGAFSATMRAQWSPLQWFRLELVGARSLWASYDVEARIDGVDVPASTEGSSAWSWSLQPNARLGSDRWGVHFGWRLDRWGADRAPGELRPSQAPLADTSWRWGRFYTGLALKF